MKKQARKLVWLALPLVVGSAQAVELKYMMWDANQKPAYQACAKQFEQQNPDIKIKIVQKGWDDYWTEITTGFIAGTAPDVFVDHLSKYPQFAKNKQLVDVAPLIKRDSVTTDIYAKGLYETWGHNGAQYGLPKDWDTIAIVYNKDMFKAAGIDPEVVKNWSWNPKDGGSFGKVMAQLSIDENGNNALNPKFDAKRVKTYGYQVSGAGGMAGQTEWSHFAYSNGFKFNDGPWSTNFHYDDPKLAETIQWIADLPKKGYSAQFQDVMKPGASASALFAAGKTAMVADGSWMISWYASNAKFKYGFAMLPVGPKGRATMFNGLADSIWAGTKNKEESWKWVKYLGSQACQSTVADYGVVFPAVTQVVEQAVKAHQKMGIDSAAFVDMARKSDTFLTPIADNASRIEQIMKASIESVFLGKTDASSALKAANTQVKAALK